jgi:hypothetical protein
MALNADARDAMLAGFTGVALYASIHSAAPDGSGSNELSGGLPAYTRVAIPWGAESGGQVATVADLEWDIPPGVDITHLGYWSAITGGVYYGDRPLSDPESFTGQGTHTIPSGSLVEIVT